MLKHLVEQEKIPREKIAVVTGDQKELDGINLFAPDCKIDFVITVEALKEGWDCSFAYVFCSVANVNSKKDVEQILGRVLRMPYAKRRSEPQFKTSTAPMRMCRAPHGQTPSSSCTTGLSIWALRTTRPSSFIEKQADLGFGDDKTRHCLPKRRRRLSSNSRKTLATLPRCLKNRQW